MARRLIITKKRKSILTLFADALADFEYQFDSTIIPSDVIRSQHLSLYSFDTKQNKIYLVYTSRTHNELLEEPFYYMAQYNYAETIYELSLGEFYAFAEAYATPTFPIALIFSTGRCGSTLLSNALKTVDNAVILSEPDFFTNLVASSLPQTEKQKLVTAAISVLFGNSHKTTQIGVIKLRSYGIELAEILFKSIVTPIGIFMYRDLKSWANSFARALKIFEPGAAAWMSAPDPDRVKYIPLLQADPTRSYTSYSPEEFITLSWLSTMYTFGELVKKGYLFTPIPYQSLQEAPERTIFTLLDGILPKEHTSIQKVLSTLDRDSQEGTPLAKLEVGGRDLLTKAHLDKMRMVIEKHIHRFPAGILDIHLLNLTST